MMLELPDFFNFDENSQNFIRNVLNTDATIFADGWNNHNIFLGESFEYNVQRLDASSGLQAWVAPIRDSGEANSFCNHHVELSGAKSGSKQDFSCGELEKLSVAGFRKCLI